MVSFRNQEHKPANKAMTMIAYTNHLELRQLQEGLCKDRDFRMVNNRLER